MESIWSELTPKPEFSSLSGDRKTDVAIIGAGMAGVLTAYFLKRAGKDVVVLEADTVGSGQTKNTTAKITSQHGLIYGRLVLEFGNLARQYAMANEAAIQAYKDIIEENHIDCDFLRVPAYLYSAVDQEALKKEAETAAQFGIDASFTTQTTLPFPIKGAVRFNNQAQFSPLKFLYEIAKKVTIYEHTRAQGIEDGKILTEKGTVQANQIVFATHFPFPNIPGYYFMRMHQERSYVLALKRACRLDGMYYGIDPDNSWSLRNAGEYLLLGGAAHRTGENRAGGKYRMLRQKAAEFWPDSVEAAHWSAQDCMPQDGVPYIGRFAATTPNWYVATGFQKWGMSSSMVAAMILTGLITDNKPSFCEIFDPGRFTPSASAKSFLDNSAHAVKDLSRRIFAPPRGAVEKLPNGHGGVVEVEGEKLGVYKDENGEIFCVSIRCPHLGCQLEWNPDEKSWDCPCHGSRFDYHGHLIDNPAQTGLERGN